MTIRTRSLNYIYSVLKFIGKLHVPYTVKKLKSQHLRQIQSIIKPGDILLATKFGSISNLLIKGKYKHAALYIGNYDVVEAISEGVILTDLIDFVLTKDRICILRPNTNQYIKEYSCKIAEEKLGEPYDDNFSSDNKLAYCSELVWLCYAINGFKLCNMIKRFGRLTILPQDIKDTGNVKLMIEF